MKKQLIRTFLIVILFVFVGGGVSKVAQKSQTDESYPLSRLISAIQSEIISIVPTEEIQNFGQAAATKNEDSLQANAENEELSTTASQQQNDRDYEYPQEQVQIVFTPTATDVSKNNKNLLSLASDLKKRQQDEASGFAFTSIEHNSTGVGTDQDFWVGLDFAPKEDFVKSWSFYPAASFDYEINGNSVHIMPHNLQISTTYNFGVKKYPICLSSESSENCLERSFSFNFTTIHWKKVVYGYSVQGRELTAYYFGKSDQNGKKIFLNGAVHGEEWRSGDLTRLVGYLKLHPEEFYGTNKSFIIVPFVNPDGAAIESRYNAHGVNLDRNWPINWVSRFDSGPYPLSEPEVIGLYNLLLQEKPNYLVSFHAQNPPNGIIFLGDNDNPKTVQFGQWASAKTGKSVGIWGGTPAAEECEWTETQGIASIIIEASYKSNSDWDSSWNFYQGLLRETWY